MKNDYRRVLALPFDTAVGVHFDQMDAEAFKGFVPLIKLMPKSYSMPTVLNYHFILVLTIKCILVELSRSSSFQRNRCQLELA